MIFDLAGERFALNGDVFDAAGAREVATAYAAVCRGDYDHILDAVVAQYQAVLDGDRE